MSRSYKRCPIVKDNVRGSKLAKAKANRHFRRCAKQDLLSGKSKVYRKYYESWNIHDFVYRWSREKAEAEWEREEFLIMRGITDRSKIYNHLHFKTKPRFMHYWRKCTIQK